ncbi:MSHA biogenesis protein MshK [Duganella sp. sic0402]|uniref:MSHA biogenesis protein MshK n=1 Tax=Duganella sp. sic0402 TaxID=2854786 RepID=UPI001C464084|nr:MSHA biogenesis protein MshK [Duganella sp. sic0402]MBV7534389.1 MSHA biogenesis protein MshK [Duganella sp. sic0402]
MKRTLCLCLLMLNSVASAQTLADPTQPPPESRLLPNVEADVQVTQGPVLQSVLIGSGGREVAVIDGQTVRKGEKFNGATLIKVSKNQVVLQNGRDKQILTLFPEVAKKAAH